MRGRIGVHANAQRLPLPVTQVCDMEGVTRPRSVDSSSANVCSWCVPFPGLDPASARAGLLLAPSVPDWEGTPGQQLALSSLPVCPSPWWPGAHMSLAMTAGAEAPSAGPHCLQPCAHTSRRL